MSTRATRSTSISPTGFPPCPARPRCGCPAEPTSAASPDMTATSVNMHFHGTNTSPRCHSDEVIRTLINSGETFNYTLHIPNDEPPGLYWYHPHVHGISSMAVQGGSTGAIEVEGIANVQPAVAGLPERYLVLRDQQRIIQSDPPGHSLKSGGYPFTPVPNLGCFGELRAGFLAALSSRRSSGCRPDRRSSGASSMPAPTPSSTSR